MPRETQSEIIEIDDVILIWSKIRKNAIDETTIAATHLDDGEDLAAFIALQNPAHHG